MPLPCAPPSARRTRHRTAVWAIAFCALLGLFLPRGAAHAHAHPHAHDAPTPAAATPGAAVERNAAEHASSTEQDHDHDHGHQHSGDPLKDLLTLGHNHVGGSCPGLPPTPWLLDTAAQAMQPIAPWPERPLVDSPPDTPFRPPIA